MNTKHILIAALLAGAFAPAVAGTGFNGADALDAESPASAAPQETRRERVLVSHANGPLRHMVHDAFGAALVQMYGKTVKNVPYSAEIVSEQQQNLADGNQIISKTTSMSYRDSAGRTRHEVRDAGGTLRTVTINDPVEGTTFVLNPEAKMATKLGPRRDLARLAGERARLRLEAMNKSGDERVIVKSVERDAETEAGQRVREEVRIRGRNEVTGAPHMAGAERIGPVIAGAFGDMKWASKASVKDLGTKEIDGVKAQGKMKSYEIPAGEIGNRNAIVVASESWYAPELQVTLMTRRSDPRTGERTWRMSNVKRDEPAAALFTVPSDYTVKDVMAQMKKMESVEKK